MAPPERVPLPPGPWGSVAALLAGCLVTLIGVIRGVDPDVILLRAVVAAVVLGVLATLAGSLVNR